MSFYLKVKETLYTHSTSYWEEKMIPIGQIWQMPQDEDSEEDLDESTIFLEEEELKEASHERPSKKAKIHVLPRISEKIQKEYSSMFRKNQGICQGELSSDILDFKINDIPVVKYTRKKLLKIAESSPYGDLSSGLNKVDLLVRRAFQIRPETVKFEFGEKFNEPLWGLKNLTQIISNTLYSSQPVTLEFNKMNIYPEGGFFSLHQDTPKDGVIGSLVIVLPTQCEGGELKIYDRDKQVVAELDVPVLTTRFKTQGFERNIPPKHHKVQDQAEKIHEEGLPTYMAFYPQYLHEVTQVVSGWLASLAFYVKMAPNLQLQASELRGSKLRLLLEASSWKTPNNTFGFILEGSIL